MTEPIETVTAAFKRSTVKDEKYDVFLVHSSLDNEKAEQINEGLKDKGLRTCAHYEDFPPGRQVIDKIVEAVYMSKTVLILLTKNALNSRWVTFEVLMGLEKSQLSDKMCVRLLVNDISDEELKEYKKTGTLHHIPEVVVDFNKKDWADELVNKLQVELPMKQLLPAGNVAHGLVFNYFIGYLAYVLPVTKETVKQCKYFSEGPFSQKFFIMIPSSCKVQSPEVGKHGDFSIEKMKKPLDMEGKHGDKTRKYNPSVYKISKSGTSEFYFFTGDTPFILATMLKMKEMKITDMDLHQQLVRFTITLKALVQHRSNKSCTDSAVFIEYEDNEGEMASAIWAALTTEFSPPKEQAGTITTKEGTMSATTTIQSNQQEYPMTATITYFNIEQADCNLAEKLTEFLSMKGVHFPDGKSLGEQSDVESSKESKEGEQRMNYIRGDFSKSRWKIFVLSENAVKDPIMSNVFQSALKDSIDNDQVQVIPVLASGSDLKKVPEWLKNTTLLKQDEPHYLTKVWRAMQEERTMKECIPAGKVYEGLAYSYLINYLPYNLTLTTKTGRDLKQRFTDAMEKYGANCQLVPKMFVIVPKSCSFPPPGTYFKAEEHLGAMEPIEQGFRKYFLQLYRLTMSDGQQVCYAREYATPAIALHEMAHTLTFAGINKQQMNEQAHEFAKLCEQILQNDHFNEQTGNVKDKCEVVYFDDEELGTEGVPTGMEGVTAVLERRMRENLRTQSL